ncbi:10500_t:CDS:10 [Scutellospora calospora]|uniref:10500_t:CDS:1 n=1 Tax=Scutellospora calospora TaxID=85575 RepID=A0ACA9KPL5_9GLOM|nr:10500_t:CDS:10 [Scutellospora calospora]
MEELNSLLDFLHDGNPNVRQLALNHLLGYTVKSSQLQHIFKQNNMRPISDLKIICRENPVIAHDAFKALVNLASDDEICKELNDDSFLLLMMKMITDSENILADMACMLLSNITKYQDIAVKLLKLEVQLVEGLSSSTKAMDQLVDVFVRGLNRAYNKEAEFHFLASLPQGREYFLTDTSYDNVTPFSKLIIFTEHPNIIRRGGVISCIKNCCFVIEHHLDMLSPSKINILPYILLPLCGMPEDIQFLPSDKKREPDSYLRQTLLECLVLLTTTRQGRTILRQKKVYPVIRQMHLVEQDKNVSIVIEQIVNMLMRDEAPEENDHNIALDTTQTSDWLKSALDQGFIKRFDYSEFENFQVIGNGGYGTVRVAYWRGGGIKVALKELNDVNFSSKIIDEVSFHPNINQFYGVTEGNREKKVSGTPSSYSNLYKNCWTSDPRKRPTLDYILKILANLLNYSGENLITNYIGHDNSISQKSIIYSLLVSQKNPNKSIAGIIDDQSCIIENSFDILNSVNKITKIPERKERVKKTSKKISKKLKISSAPYHRDSVHIKKGSNDEVSQHIQNVIHMEGDVLIPDIIDFNLKVLFVEINPGNSSAETGHNFAHESNHFYPCLIESGITNNEYVTYMDDRSFPTRFKIGIVNAVNRCTNSNAKNLSNAEKYNSIEPLLKKVKKYKPKILCFVGKMIFDSFVKYCKNNGLQSNRIFWNDQNGFTKVFAMPSTSARVKSYEKSDKLRYFKELKILMDQ